MPLKINHGIADTPLWVFANEWGSLHCGKIISWILVFRQRPFNVCWWWLIWPIQKYTQKTLQHWLNPLHTCVLIWEYSARAFQWIPTWQGLDSFQKSLRSCVWTKVASALEGLNLELHSLTTHELEWLEPWSKLAEQLELNCSNRELVDVGNTNVSQGT